MLTKVIIRHFKRFDEVEIELGSPVLFVGPNNCGKTSALQALALWEVGVRRWMEKRAGSKTPEKRPGVTINRRDLIAIPVPAANLLWRDLHTRDTVKGVGTKNVRVEIVVEGVADDAAWVCGLEFDYANPESFYCRPLRIGDGQGRMPVPKAAADVLVAFLPPMSGLASTEMRLEPGTVNVRIGEGRTAEVLRNLCHAIHEENPAQWDLLSTTLNELFGVTLDEPRYLVERGEIELGYRDRGVRLDLSASGRGLQQTLLLLAYMYRNPGAVLLLDEPDAHLEILRQRQIYQLLADTAAENGNQIIAATHSEVLLNEAAVRDLVIAFLGDPHPISDRGSQLAKSLREIGFEDYFQAEQTGWVLYLEGSTDLAFLRSFAKVLGHAGALKALERPFVKYVGNQPKQAAQHYHGLREAVPALQAVAVFDRLDQDLPPELQDVARMWKRREIENYVCDEETLLAFVVGQGRRDAGGPLFESVEVQRRTEAMRAAIGEVRGAMQTLGHGSPWDPNTKVSDNFLTPLFRKYSELLGIPNLMAKKDFYELAVFVRPENLAPEVSETLDRIASVAEAASSGKAAPA